MALTTGLAVAQTLPEQQEEAALGPSEIPAAEAAPAVQASVPVVALGTNVTLPKRCLEERRETVQACLDYLSNEEYRYRALRYPVCETQRERLSEEAGALRSEAARLRAALASGPDVGAGCAATGLAGTPDSGLPNPDGKPPADGDGALATLRQELERVEAEARQREAALKERLAEAENARASAVERAAGLQEQLDDLAFGGWLDSAAQKLNALSCPQEVDAGRAREEQRLRVVVTSQDEARDIRMALDRLKGTGVAVEIGRVPSLKDTGCPSLVSNELALLRRAQEPPSVAASIFDVHEADRVLDSLPLAEDCDRLSLVPGIADLGWQIWVAEAGRPVLCDPESGLMIGGAAVRTRTAHLLVRTKIEP